LSTATNADGAAVKATASADAFRLCFVQKNRIESCSRIAAKTLAQRAELITTLFG
jgi:hypothetical protein